jgi:hypothetical protein
MAAKKAAKKSDRASATTPQDGDGVRLQYCNQPPRVPRELPRAMSPGQMRAIVLGADKWLNGTVLHYYFFGPQSGSSPAWIVPERQREIIRTAFSTWQGLGIGVQFREVTAVSEAEVRIGFDQSDGSWSYVGKDVLAQPQTERTMNFGWDLAADAYGMTTALHEIGHTLGMPHEHQNPFAGIVWDEEAVYTFLGGPPNNWSRQTTFFNVLRKLDTAEVSGSPWDPSSIMEYSFPRGLIVTPAAYSAGIDPPGTLSALDKEFMLSWYPSASNSLAVLDPFASVSAALVPGQQIDYMLRPSASRSYSIASFGDSDTMLGLFERVDGELRFVAGDDNGGENRNAKLQHKLFAGREYVVRLRCYYSQRSATTALMYW